MGVQGCWGSERGKLCENRKGLRVACSEWILLPGGPKGLRDWRVSQRPRGAAVVGSQDTAWVGICLLTVRHLPGDSLVFSFHL